MTWLLRSGCKECGSDVGQRWYSSSLPGALIRSECRVWYVFTLSFLLGLTFRLRANVRMLYLTRCLVGRELILSVTLE